MHTYAYIHTTYQRYTSSSVNVHSCNFCQPALIAAREDGSQSMFRLLRFQLPQTATRWSPCRRRFAPPDCPSVRPSIAAADTRQNSWRASSERECFMRSIKNDSIYRAYNNTARKWTNDWAADVALRHKKSM